MCIYRNSMLFTFGILFEEERLKKEFFIFCALREEKKVYMNY